MGFLGVRSRKRFLTVSVSWPARRDRSLNNRGQSMTGSSLGPPPNLHPHPFTYEYKCCVFEFSKRNKCATVLCLFFLCIACSLMQSSDGEHTEPHIAYIRGDLPLVFAVGHGGKLAPSNIPDRACVYGNRACTSEPDFFTIEMMEAIVARIEQAYAGKRPHVIINKLHRSKLDPNRRKEEGAQGNELAEAAWTDYHRHIDHARSEALKRFSAALIIDLHGHSHKHGLIELGYMLRPNELAVSDDCLSSLWHRSSYLPSCLSSSLLPPPHSSSSSSSSTPCASPSASLPSLSNNTLRSKSPPILDTHTVPGLGSSQQASLSSSSSDFPNIIRGPDSLGGILEALGFPSIPSPAHTHVLDGQPYFNGGFTTLSHGARAGGQANTNTNSLMNAIQIEIPYAYRVDKESRARFARALVTALDSLMSKHFSIELSALRDGASQSRL